MVHLKHCGFRSGRASRHRICPVCHYPVLGVPLAGVGALLLAGTLLGTMAMANPTTETANTTAAEVSAATPTDAALAETGDPINPPAPLSKQSTPFSPPVPSATAHATLPAIDPGPRPLRLVQDLDEGPLKRRLLSCAQGPFQRTAFAIGHRGACLAYPEHTRESYLAAAHQGAGFIECDVTFTKDLELVCRHAQNDLHTSTDILSIPDLAAKCRRPFTPATFAPDGQLLTPASAECWTSDLTLAEFRRLRGRRDGFNPRARTVEEYQQPPDIAWSGLAVGAEYGTLLTHRESIALFQELGVMMIPELKESLVPLPFGGLSRTALAQRLIDDYKAAGVDPRRVWPQSFLREDIRSWLAEEPDFGRQAVYLEAAERVADLPSPAELRGYRAEGIRIVAPPLFALLEGDASGAIRPSPYARDARSAGLAIIPWSLERSGSLAAPDKGTNNGVDNGTNIGADYVTDKGFYYQTLNAAIRREGDVLRVLDVLAQEVGILAIFSDWPATVTYYANCMGLAIEPEVKSSWPRYPLR
jgi:glycerophosphoryl diester phosphodiesterase